MPRRKVEGKIVKRRSRNGCHNCKKLKIKCDEAKPTCKNCSKINTECDYSIKLSWGGRPYKKPRVDTCDQYTALVSGQRTVLKLSAAKLGEGLDGGNAVLASFGIGDNSLPASIRDISRIFKPSPFQQPVTIESFIVEKPHVYYTTSKFDNANSQPNRIASEIAARSLKTPAPQSLGPSTDVRLSSALKTESLVEPNESISSSSVPRNRAPHSGTYDHRSPSPASSATSNLFNTLGNSNDMPFPDLKDYPEFNLSYDFQGDANSLEPSAASPNSHFYSIPITSDKQLTISSQFDLKNLNLSAEDDFERDLQALESTQLQYSSLIQLPLRDSASKAASPSTQSSGDSYDGSDVNADGSENSYMSIPRSLDPLPDLLLAVPTYRDLFHHYVYVTADIMVPAPIIYPQNPFKTILPAMALQTPHLLALLLAFSAHHRARFLRMELPTEVISRLLTRVFQGFIKCLENEKEAKSDTTLTTAVLLTSFEILTSGGRNSWKTHMHGARDIVISRDIAQSLLELPLSYNFNQPHNKTTPSPPVSPMSLPNPKVSLDENGSSNVIGPKPLGVLKSDIDETNVSYFLVRWFAYIDVIGSLSSFKASAFLTTNEDMAQLWGLHDWHLARIKQRSLDEIEHSRSLSTTPSLQGPDAIQSNGEILDISARHYGIKVDFLLGIDLDVLPLFSKISFLVRQRQRLTESLKTFFNDNPEATEDSSEWIQNWKKADQNLKSEALELSDILLSLCEAYELRRKHYITNAIGIMERKRRDSNSSSNSSTGSSPTNTKESPTNSISAPKSDAVADAFDYAAIFGTTPPSSTAAAPSDVSILPASLNDPNEFVFSAESVEKLNSALKKAEDIIPTISQLPASVQAHSQLSIMNTTFCYAAIIHLYRRVMNLPSQSPMVQNIVKHNTKLLNKYIPLGSPVEACMSFPVFTIACEVLEDDQATRQKYWLRLKGMDRFGVDQTSVARQVVEQCWKEKRDWQEILQDIGWDIALP